MVAAAGLRDGLELEALEANRATSSLTDDAVDRAAVVFAEDGRRVYVTLRKGGAFGPNNSPHLQEL